MARSGVGVIWGLVGLLLAGCGSSPSATGDGSSDAPRDRSDAAADGGDPDTGSTDTSGAADVADAAAAGVDAADLSADVADVGADVADVPAGGDVGDARDAARDVPSAPDGSVWSCSPTDARPATDASSECTPTGLIDLASVFGKQAYPMDFNERGDLVVTTPGTLEVWSLEKGCSTEVRFPGEETQVPFPRNTYHLGAPVLMNGRSSFVTYLWDGLIEHGAICAGTCRWLSLHTSMIGKHTDWFFGINNVDQVAGAFTSWFRASTEMIPRHFDAARATLWTPGAPGQTLVDVAGTHAVAINDAGQVVFNLGGAILWDQGTMTPLGSLGGWARASAISADGKVIGSSSLSPGGPVHAFVWSQGTMRDLGTLGGTNSSAWAINSSGQIVGESDTASGATHLFFWDAGVMRDIGTLGGSSATLSAFKQEILWTARHTLNDAGQVVGTSTTASGYSHAFLWQNGVMTDLGTLPGHKDSQAVGISASGQVVVASGTRLPPNTELSFTNNNPGVAALYDPARCPH